MMQVHYRLKDYHKEASEKYRLDVTSKGSYLSVPRSDENLLLRYVWSREAIFFDFLYRLVQGVMS